MSNVHRRVSGAARGQAKVARMQGAVAKSEHQKRHEAGLTSEQTADIPREVCSECGRHVALRADGQMKGHQASKGISCVGATPTEGGRRT